MFTFKAIKKTHPMVPAAVPAALSSKWELTACNAFSRPSGDQSTASQSSTRRTAAAGYHYYVVATGFLHPLEPQVPLPTAYPAHHANCLTVDTVH